MNKKMVLFRNAHPEEVAAFFVAGKVTEYLKRRGESVFLKTVPFSETLTGLFVKLKKEKGMAPIFKPPTEYMLFEQFFEKTLLELQIVKTWRESIFLDFHNYAVNEFEPEEIKCSPIFSETIVITEDGIRITQTVTDFEKVLCDVKGYPVLYSQRDKSKPIYTLELPALYKRLQNPFYRGFEKNDVVDFQATKDRGLVSEGFIAELGEQILKLKNKIEAEDGRGF